MMWAVSRKRCDTVAAWSVDRLARSMPDLLDLLTEFHAKGVDLYLHEQDFDSSTPAGKAMFQMIGVFGEFERAMIRERVLLGLDRAKTNGTLLGRRMLEHTHPKKVVAIRAMRANGIGINNVASTLGVGVGTVRRISGYASH